MFDLQLWNIIDWAGTILSLYSIWLITDVKRIGFVIGIVSGLVWIAIAINSHLTGLLVLNAVIIIIYIKGYFAWGKKIIKKIESIEG